MSQWRVILSAWVFLEAVLGGASALGPGNAALAQSLALPPTPPKFHCVLKGRSDAWITAAAPGCYSFEVTSNGVSSIAKAKAANPPAGHFVVMYRVLATGWTSIPSNSPFRPETGALTEADFYHHRTAGSRAYHSAGNTCCTAANAPYPCCNDNSECTGSGAPFACCTGAGTGTCTLAADSTCNTPEIVSWDACTAENPADCPATSRWDKRHTLGKNGPGCFSAGAPYDSRAEGEHELVNLASQHVRDLVVADADRLTSGAECSPACAIDGIRIDEPQVGYAVDGMDFTDVKELPVASSATDATHYVNDFVGLLSWVKTQRPSFKIFPSLPFFLNDREGDWDRQIVAAARGMATERMGSQSYTRVCTAWSGNTCIEGTRAATIAAAEWDTTVDLFSSFARLLYAQNNPNIEVIIEPFKAGRGMTWIQELCADAGDACYFGVTNGCGAAASGVGCYSNNGVISSISNQ